MCAVAVVEEIEAVVVRFQWPENSHGLLSWWDLMMFDAGRLANHVMHLSRIASSFPLVADHTFANLRKEHRDDCIGLIKAASDYCDEVPFLIARLPLTRILGRVDEPGFTLGSLCEMLDNAMERLRDEAETIQLLRIPTDRIKYYTDPQPLGSAVANNFPSVSFDAIEACQSFALGRSTACVFHLMRVLEIGLTVFAARFGVPSDHVNWHPIIEGIEKKIRNMGNDPLKTANWKDEQEFYSQAASHFMFVKDAWRNYTAHARGKYTDVEAEVMIINVRGFIQKLSTRLHE